MMLGWASKCRLDEPFLQEYAKVPIDRRLISVFRMNDKKSLHPNAICTISSGMRMIHLHAMLA